MKQVNHYQITNSGKYRRENRNSHDIFAVSELDHQLVISTCYNTRRHTRDGGWVCKAVSWETWCYYRVTCKVKVKVIKRKREQKLK